MPVPGDLALSTKALQAQSRIEEETTADDGTLGANKKRQKKKPLDPAQLQMKEQLEQHKVLEIKKLKESNQQSTLEFFAKGKGKTSNPEFERPQDMHPSKRGIFAAQFGRNGYDPQAY